MEEKFFHSVYLDDSLCMGCVNCIKRCPTEAIRVRDGKAYIIKKFCIDCGECVRTCGYHAKKIRRDNLKSLERFAYTVALPPPSLYGQFNNLNDINIVLTALLCLGFDDVYEVSDAAEQVSEASRTFVQEHRENWPYISTACPTITRLIRVRFPGLIDHLLPLNPPVEVAARMARAKAMEKTGLPAEKIGIFFLSPCPAKVTYAAAPLGVPKSEIDGVLAIKDLYPKLLPQMKETQKAPLPLSTAGRIGVGWGSSGGEAAGMETDSYLAADGIENVIRVLEQLEDEKLNHLRFIELDACPGGCVGGTLNVENPYVARSRLKRLNGMLPPKRNAGAGSDAGAALPWTESVRYEPVFRLGNDVHESIAMAQQVEELVEQLPGLDCGSCGAPTCRARAEDIVRGKGSIQDCIHVLKRNVKDLSAACTELAKDALSEEIVSGRKLEPLLDNLKKLGAQAALMDGPAAGKSDGEPKKEEER